MTGVQQTGERVEALIAELRGSADPAAAGAAEELVGLLVGLYGDGLARVVGVLAAHGEAGAQLLAALTQDPLVASLLVLHDLHPVSTDERISHALDQVRPYLGSHAGGVQYLGVTDGVARLRLEGSCHGCPSSAMTVQMAIEDAILNAAPEVTAVEVAGMTEEQPAPLLQIGRTPPPEWAAAHTGWETLPEIGPPTGAPVTLEVAGVAVALCSVRGTLYAYRDACAGCGSALGGATLAGDVLTCPGCGRRFDIRLAGRSLTDGGHLDPFPLLSDSRGTRIGLPRAVAS
jgi:Fe-S cluster biogenesis protein NfuA/nitrite reductase/ring-hydroxylating ferredoxin subunit